jgi:hypothetical protein
VSFAIRSASFCLLNFVAIAAHAVLITQWNFNSTTADSNVATGVLTPSTGSGTASLVGNTTSTFATGSPGGTATATDNSGWNVSTFPAQGAGSGTAGSQFAVSTSGYNNIVLTFDLRQSGTVSRFFQLLVSADGTTFTAPSGGTASIAGPIGSGNTGTSFSNTGLYSNNPGGGSQNFVQGLTYTFAPGSIYENDPNFKFKLVAVFDPATGSQYIAANAGTAAGYSSNGTFREDSVGVSGTLITAVPESPAFLLGTFVCGGLSLWVGALRAKSRLCGAAL